MKHLTTYRIFESKLLPSNFIKLNSIGHALDPKTGWIYPLHSNGIYYHDDDGLNIEWDDVTFDGINDKDMDIVNGLWKSVEPIVKDKINFDLINKLKDLSLDAIDDGFTLYYSIYVGEEDVLRIAFGGFGQQGLDYLNYNRKFPENFQFVMDHCNGDLLYRFRLASREHENGYMIANEILGVLKDITGYDNIETTD